MFNRSSVVGAGMATLAAMLMTHPAAAKEMPAQTVLTGGKVYTIDGDFSVAEAVAVRDGRVWESLCVARP